MKEFLVKAIAIIITIFAMAIIIVGGHQEFKDMFGEEEKHQVAYDEDYPSEEDYEDIELVEMTLMEKLYIEATT